MNCKPGDIAVIVADRNFSENIGRLVCILGPCNARDYSVPRDWDCRPLQPVWGRALGKAVCDERDTAFYDRELRPLRDSDAPDETLTWAGKPQAAERGFTKVTP